MLLPATSSLGQSAASGDRISGRWTGNGATYLELAYDGASAISGRVYFRHGARADTAAVKRGTFDSRTGTFRLEGDAPGRDGQLAPYMIEGSVDGDTVAGMLKSGGDALEFKFARGVDAGSSQAAPAALTRSFTQASGWITKAADLVPADKYAYRPVATVRTFGQLIAHISDEYNFYCAKAAGRNQQWTDANEKGAADKGTIVQKLKESLDGCRAAYAKGTDVGALVDNLADAYLHYGNAATYLRMMGLVPPSSSGS